jgi:hypothetical protein
VCACKAFCLCIRIIAVGADYRVVIGRESKRRPDREFLGQFIRDYDLPFYRFSQKHFTNKVPHMIVVLMQLTHKEVVLVKTDNFGL